MIPYFEWHIVTLGPLTLRVWGFFAALGVVSASWFAMRQAKRLGFDMVRFESMLLWTIVWSFLGARLLHVFAYEPSYFLAHPFGVFEVWKGGLSSFGGFLGAAASFFWHMRAKPFPLMKTADVLVMATPLGLGCGRIGCFLIHDHPGTLAHGAGKWFAVNYPDGARYDLGLLLGAFDFALFALFVVLSRKPRVDGFYFALFMLVYGPVRFTLDFLRAIDIRYFGLTPGQYGAVALFVAGCYLMRRIRTGGFVDGNHHA
jgi:phosphatidylglycerol:prolipoprotein diacylglycerol transferase